MDIAKFDEAVKLIKEKNSEDKLPKGHVECPVCGKDLYYSVSTYNGHIWAKCDTEGCLAWMM